jgi:hypothetical protein
VEDEAVGDLIRTDRDGSGILERDAEGLVIGVGMLQDEVPIELILRRRAVTLAARIDTEVLGANWQRLLELDPERGPSQHQHETESRNGYCEALDHARTSSYRDQDSGKRLKPRQPRLG